MKIAVRRVLLMSALLAPGALYALGLGEIKLNSALNQPFDAEIELVSATQEDLGALRAALASSDTFVRYGLDRPSYLSEFSFLVAKGSDGTDILRVTSPRPVTEPFVTLLVEANWPRGRLLREYTVLLDPPVYAPGPVAAEPVAVAPRVSSGGATSTRTAAPVASVSNEPVRVQRAEPVASPSIEPGSTYRVRRNDTLWQIASAANPGTRSDVNRAMVSIYQNNPQAFDGNINVLRSGSTLNIPDANQIRSISAAEASAEVARQYDAWRNGTRVSSSARAEESGRLRLVAPEQGTIAPSTATSAPAKPGSVTPSASAPAAATDASLESRVQQLESDLAEARRLLEVRNAELATLQGDSTAPADAAGTESKPAPAQVDKPKKAKKPKVAAPPEPSLLERLTGYWWLLLGLVALGLGGWLFQRSRRERGSAEDSLEEALAARDTRSQMKFTPRSRDGDIVVEEKAGADVGRPAVAAAAATRSLEPTQRLPTVEDTLSGEGPSSLESGDPLAEADFHMAYGLYDQAADLVQLAMKREPQRRDLKLKLLEIFFVWGNKEKFLGLARDLHSSRAEAPAGEWDKVLIMGKQIAPGDGLFSGNLTTASTDSLDMELHGAPGTLDLVIPEATAAPLPDMDFSETATEIAKVDTSGLDFVFDDPTAVMTDIQAGPDLSSMLPTIEMPQIGESDGVGDTQELTVDRLGLDIGTLRGVEALDANEAIDARTNTTSDTIETNTVAVPRSLLDDDSEDLLTNTALTRMVDDTSLLPRDESLEGIVDLSDATGEMPSIDSTAFNKALDGEVDFDIGGEPATMSEVGTKLDLARAYMDMGDPEGARSILDEVMQEGNPTQREEAERLIANLP
jgi:pilus assembly protein FimV